MKYLCLVYHDVGTDLNAISDDDFNDIIEEVEHCVDELSQNGHLVAASPLQPPDTVMTLRVQRGTVSVTDGPFIETKETLAGFYLLEARDQNEAIRLAAKTPSARLGAIEVRPLAPLARRP